jgi:hypothetical protein
MPRKRASVPRSARTTARPTSTSSGGRSSPRQAPNGRGMPKKGVAAPPGKPQAEFVRGARLMDTDEPDIQPEEFTEVNDLRQRLFLAAFARVPRIGRAAKAAGVSTVTVWHWRNRPDDLAFQAAFARAYQLGIEAAEGELWRRGVEGVEKPIYQSGRMCGTVREFDTGALTFALKANYREKYGDQSKVEHGGVGGGPIQVAQTLYVEMSNEELDRRLLNSKQIIDVTPPKQIEAAPGEKTPEQLYAERLAARNGGGES